MINPSPADISQVSTPALICWAFAGPIDKINRVATRLRLKPRMSSSENRNKRNCDADAGIRKFSIRFLMRNPTGPHKHQRLLRTHLHLNGTRLGKTNGKPVRMSPPPKLGQITTGRKHHAFATPSRIRFRTWCLDRADRDARARRGRDPRTPGPCRQRAAELAHEPPHL